MEGTRRLRAMLGEVERMLVEVGSEAPRFRDSLKLLRSDLNRELAKPVKVYGSTTVLRLGARLSVLGTTFQPLMQLVRESASVKERANALRDTRRRNWNAAVSEHFARKLAATISTLDDLLVGVERIQDLEEPQRVLTEVSADLRRYEEASAQLNRAAQWIESLNKVRTAEFQVALSDLINRLCEGALDAAWLAEMEKNLDALRAIGDEPRPQPPPPPPALLECQHMLPKVDRWSTALNLPIRHEFGDQLQRAEDLAKTGAPPGIEQLFEDLRLELATLEQEAASRRERLLTEFQEDYFYYKDCCGPDKRVAGDLEQLVETLADSPENYKDWIKHHDEASRYFLNVCRARLDILTARLLKGAKGLQERLEIVRARALSDAAASEASRVAGALIRLRETNGLDAVMAALRLVTSQAASSLNMALAALEERSSREWSEYLQARELLLERVASLQTAAMDANVQESDLSLEIGIETPGVSLTVLYERLNLASEAVDRKTKTFLSDCRGQVQLDLEFCASARDSLEIVAADLPEIPAIPPLVVDPVEAASLLVRVRALRQVYENRVEDGTLRMQTGLVAANKELETWLRTPGYLGVEDRDSALEWCADYLAHCELPLDSGLTDLGVKAGLLGRYKALSLRLEREAREVADMRQDSQLRLQRFSREEYGRFFPDLSQRVAALVYGVDLRSRQWASAREQLHEALRLLDGLEFQARRLVAQEVLQGREAIDRELHRSVDPARQKALQLLADSLDRHPHGELVPLALRRRLADVRLDPAERRSHA